MKFFLIAFILLVSCSDSSFIAEGRILDIKKGDLLGDFEYIELNVNNEKIRFYSDNKIFDHYTYDHLISHQLNGDYLEINYEKKSQKNIIIEIVKHDHSH